MNDDFDITPIDWDMSQGAIIKVIGVGGGGNNAVNYMANLGIAGVDFAICNTDGQVLQNSAIKNKIQLGCELTRGRGAGCDPEIGKQAAIESIDNIKLALSDNTEMVFITAGMGGGTGTGATPVIAKVAKEMDILTVAIVTLPFKDEGLEPQRRAIAGINELKNHVDSLLLISNNKLYEMYGDLSLRDGFKKADKILASAAKGIAEIITKSGYINVDFADVKKVMKNSGVALLGTGRGTGENRAIDAVDAALKSPLLNNNSIKGAKNILVNITSSETKEKEIKFSELRDIMDYIQREAGRVENIKRGVIYDQSLGDELNITIVATGFEMNDATELHVPILNKDKDKSIITITDGYSQQHIQFDVVKPKNEDEDADNYTQDEEQIQIDDDIISDNDNFIEKDNIQIYTKKEDSNLQNREILEIKPNNNDNIVVKKQLTELNKKEILQLEEEPAFKRKNIKIETQQQSNQSIASRTLEKNKDNKFVLRSNNAYLNPEVD
ncbi:MAG: cell division protein FtsZ [Prevotellaceae bacterium]|jgi:cell division protein FtsZ|nr:cell division protein FtsZ [Prevotellaceae bacterium]